VDLSREAQQGHSLATFDQVVRFLAAQVGVFVEPQDGAQLDAPCAP
jgi:hypothetical protein